jgi:exportin-T
VRNKAAQLFALAFIVDYPTRWPLFYGDLLEWVGRGNEAATDLYLRVLQAVDSEVVDRDIAHTTQVSTSRYNYNTWFHSAQ